MDAPGGVQEFLDELMGLEGVRGVMIAVGEEVLGAGVGGALAPHVAVDVARTVRRMTVASSTVRVPVRDLVINFGGARMLIVTLGGDANLVVLMVPGASLDPVRSLLELEWEDLRSRLSHERPVADPGAEGPVESSAEIDQLRSGPLGEVLQAIERRFAMYVRRSADEQADPAQMMTEQIQQWLLCCSPSAYTFPLLLDGLAQQLADTPDLRARFLAEVQRVVQDSEVWAAEATKGERGG